jgi:hypothetical protein
MPEVLERVLAFVREYIDSVDQLEILLLLRGGPEREWTAEEISRALSTSEASVVARLAYLQSVGLVEMKRPSHYRYAPKSQDVAQVMEEVSAAYAQYRVRIINLIYSKPIDKIRTFADAFKLRKEDE